MMKVKLVINPNQLPGSCKGCVFSKERKCTRPEGYDSCIVDSSYGSHFGIYVEDKTDKESKR